MKQEITFEEWDDCSIEMTAKWRLWRENKGYAGMPSIGQMIEFLDEHKNKQSLHLAICHYGIWRVGTLKGESIYPFYDSDKEELCDALWVEVKRILSTPELINHHSTK